MGFLDNVVNKLQGQQNTSNQGGQMQNSHVQPNQQQSTFKTQQQIIFQSQQTNNQPQDQNKENTKQYVPQSNINQNQQIQQTIKTQQPNTSQPLNYKQELPKKEQKIDIKYPENFDNMNFKDQLLSLMVENEASDAFPVVGHYPSIRIKGLICYIERIPKLKSEDVQDLIESFLDADQRLKYLNNKEIDFAAAWKGQRFRINAFHQMKQPSLCIRYLRNDILSMQQLGLPIVIAELAQRSSGIILVCGVTGSGKSTTLSAIVDYINSNYSKHIITIEDPVEYTYEKKKSIIEQREVETDTKSFAAAMKSALRQNPNVLLLGEMRDLESIASAITIAEGGHLVLSTIHARNSVQCINKIIDAFPADQQEQIRVQISEALCAIITQKLIPGTDGKLKLVMEIMINNSAIANMIRESQTHQIESAIQTSKKEGMQLMDEDILKRYNKGEISRENAIAYAIKPRELENLIN